MLLGGRVGHHAGASCACFHEARSAASRLVAVTRMPVHPRAGAGGDETADDHVLLEADQRVLLPSTAACVSTRVVSWNDAAEMNDRVCRLALVMPSSTGLPTAFRLPLVELGVELVHLLTIDLLARQQRGVAAVGDLDLLQHLANDHLDVLVVDLHALEPIDLLDLGHEVLGQRLDAQHLEDVVRVGRARDQRVALLDEVAFLDVDHLGLGDQVLDRATFFRNDRDLALGLVLADELDPSRDLGDDRVVLRNARLEQLGHPRQTAGDVAGLGGFTRGTGEDVAGLDVLAVLDRQRGARGEHVARGLGIVVLLGLALALGVVRAEQRQARTQVLLLRAAGRAILGDHALGDAGGLVDALFQGLAFGQILVAHRCPAVSVMIGRVNGSHSARRSPSFTFAPFGEHQHRAVGHAVDRALAAFRVDHRHLAVAGERQATAALVGDGRHVAVFDRAVRDRFEVAGLVDLRRAADVERAHGQLGARLTDRLRGDHADRLADVDRRAAGEIAPVARGADALLGFADQRASGS